MNLFIKKIIIFIKNCTRLKSTKGRKKNTKKKNRGKRKTFHHSAAKNLTLQKMKEKIK